jgi:hypothetical protein
LSRGCVAVASVFAALRRDKYASRSLRRSFKKSVFVVWTLSWLYNGSVLPCSKVIFAVSFIHIFPTHSGIGWFFFFKTGPKKAILRTGAHECARGNMKRRQETPFYTT